MFHAVARINDVANHTITNGVRTPSTQFFIEIHDCRRSASSGIKLNPYNHHDPSHTTPTKSNHPPQKKYPTIQIPKLPLGSNDSNTRPHPIHTYTENNPATTAAINPARQVRRERIYICMVRATLLTPEGVGGRRQEAEQTAAVVMDLVVEVLLGLLAQLLLHVAVAATPVADR